MALSTLFDIHPREISWLALLLGSIAPDLDEDGSSISKPGTLLRAALPKTFCDILDSLGMAVSKVIKLVFGHRGLLHWPILAVVIMGLGLRYGVPWLYWFGIGYVTHVAADACTVSGVPLFAPIRRDCVSWSSMKTGGAAERIIVILFGLFMVWWGISTGARLNPGPPLPL